MTHPFPSGRSGDNGRYALAWRVSGGSTMTTPMALLEAADRDRRPPRDQRRRRDSELDPASRRLDLRAAVRPVRHDGRGDHAAAGDMSAAWIDHRHPELSDQRDKPRVAPGRSNAAGCGADQARIIHEVYQALPASTAADRSGAWRAVARVRSPGRAVSQAMMRTTGAEDEAADEVASHHSADRRGACAGAVQASATMAPPRSACAHIRRST